MQIKRVNDGRLPSFVLQYHYNENSGIYRIGGKNMSDLYQEILIQRETPFVNKLIKAALIVFTVLLVIVAFLLHPLLLVAAVIFGCVSFFYLIPKLEVEYEYLYVNGELDIDVIYSKQKRKKVASYNVNDLEILAPERSHALDAYRNRNLKVRDFSSGKEGAKTYLFVFNTDKGQEMLKAEPGEIILNDMRRLAPRKVNLM